jgi:predicted permease
MSLLASLMTTVRGLWQRRRAHGELDDELAFHVEQETDANIARGMTPDEARIAALRAFGGITQAKEMVRDVRTLPIESIWQDVRHAARVLGARPRFTLATAGMLALAIGLTTAMFTLVDALIVRPVPFRDPDRLAHVLMGTDRGGRTIVAPAVVRAWRESPAFAAAESASSDTALIEVAGTVVERDVATVTPGLFDMLGGVRPLHGRLFSPTDGRPGQSDRLLVSETAWRALFNADPSLVGQAVIVDGERLTVIGILPAEFRFPSAKTVFWRPTDLGGAEEWAVAYVRFAPGVPREDALRLATTAARDADATNATLNLRARVYPVAGLADDYTRRALPLLMGAVLLVFLVLCGNVSSLLLARLTARRREFGMRAALGAARGRLMRQALIESAVLGTVGLIIGAGMAWALVAIARALLPEPLLLQTLNPLNLDARALSATSLAGLSATLAAGLVPAWLGTSVDAGDSLRVVDRSKTEPRSTRALSRALLIVEVALACTLLVGATLLTRSFVNIARADRGLDTTNVTTLWLALPAVAAKDVTARALLARNVDDTLRQLPGVRALAWSYGLPPGGGMWSHGEWISDLRGAPAVNMDVARYNVSQEFFALYGIPILKGRSFAPSDDYATVIVSERFAAALWPAADPIGRTFRFGKEQFRVVGLAREIHYPSIDALRDGPEFYHPYQPASTPMVSLRCDPACPPPAVIRHRLASAHPTVRVQDAAPIELDYAAEIARPKAAAALAGTFAVIGVIAAAGGLYGVLSYAVGRRRREFGIRAALGASRGEIRRVVLRDAAVVATSGVAIGALFAAVLARAVSSLQYGVTPGDPLSWSLVLGMIALTTGVASWGPAAAAATLDPLVLLRED